jgi:uncharacterized protein (TIGR04255 family)
MSLEFSNLPLVEVSVRLYFAKTMLLSLEQGTIAREGLSERFPQFLDLDHLEPGLGGLPIEVGLIPGREGFSHMGFRYAGSPAGLEFCLQPNLISIKWTKKFDPDSKPYPRFEVLEDHLWWAYEILSKRLPLPATAAVNLRYANFIPTDAGASGTVLRDYFSDAVNVTALGKATMLHDVNISWREADLIDRRFTLAKGFSGDGESQVEGFLLATVAGMGVVPEVSPKSRLTEIHAFLQTFFSSLISERAKKEWGLGG